MVRRSGWLKGQVARLLPPGETILQLRSRATPSGRVVVAGTDRAFYVMQGAGRPKTAVRLPHEHIAKVRVNDDLFVISLRSGQDYVVDVGSPLSKSLAARTAGLWPRPALPEVLGDAIARLVGTASEVRRRWSPPSGAHASSPASATGPRRRRTSSAELSSGSGFELEALPALPAPAAAAELGEAAPRRRRSRSDASRQ